MKGEGLEVDDRSAAILFLAQQQISGRDATNHTLTPNP
jgi:hypothetical protein